MYYLKSSDRTTTEPFFAIKVKKVLYPCTYQLSAKSGDYRAFVRGTGWKKAKEAVIIPVYSGTTKDEFEAYLTTYGKECLYYSMTGYELNSNDCCAWHSTQEFQVLLSVGYDYMESFHAEISKINTLISNSIKNYLGVTEITRWIEVGDKFYSSTDFFEVRPCYSMMVYFLTAPHVDVINDDSKLEKHFIALHKPTEIEMNNFPESMKDRIIFLFGKDVADLYHSIMSDFPMFLQNELVV